MVLSAPTGGVLLNSAAKQATVTIQRSDGPVAQFSPESAFLSVYENAGTVRLTVTANPAPAFTTYVYYNVTLGTALPTSDYLLAAGTLVFGAGQTSQVGRSRARQCGPPGQRRVGCVCQFGGGGRGRVKRFQPCRLLTKPTPSAAPQVILVAIVDDAITEPVETFSVTLTGANMAATLGKPVTSVVTIYDNVSPPLTRPAESRA